MKSKKVIYPKVVAGGSAEPLGNNFYFMNGRKHSKGGITIGKNPKTGLEVEGGEIMHMTPKEVKVFSSVPLLNGESPAEKILKGHNPAEIFNAQEKFKTTNGLNDDGTSKKNGGKSMNKYALGGPGPKKKRKAPTPKKTNTNNLSLLTPNAKPSILTGDLSRSGDAIEAMVDEDMRTAKINTTPVGPKSTWWERQKNSANVITSKIGEAVGGYVEENPGVVGDAVGLVSNTVGGLIANRANNRMLDRMKYASAPVAKQAAKLKTRININPQLDKMRETVASYERDVNNNTASSRVALGRNQRARSIGQQQANELYGAKENAETELINQDNINQQRVASDNTDSYNRWAEGKANFENAINEKRSENTIGLVETLNAGVQDMISRGEKRAASKDNMLAMSAASPNVNPRILKDLGVRSITDKMVADWEKANPKNKKKSKV